jgi:ESCRT-I complex subunit TSG101
MSKGDILSKLENRKKAASIVQSIDVGQILQVEHTLYRQLLKLISDDRAIEDTLYHIGKKFQSHHTSDSAISNSGLAAYLKCVRTLSHEQFLKRALTLKILNHLNDDSTSPVSYPSLSAGK